MAQQLTVLYEDNHLLAVAKRAGVLTVGDRAGRTSLLRLASEYIKRRYDKPGNVFLAVVHRLDRPVSGVVLFGRTGKAARRLCRQFRDGTVIKRYWAWVQGRPAADSGRLQDYLVKDRQRNLVRVAGPDVDGARLAAADYRVIARCVDRTLVEVRLHTGRSHQIRVQLAARGWPVLGDVKYGGPRLVPGQIALHAAELTVRHPTSGEPLTVQLAEAARWNESFARCPPVPAERP